MKKLIILFLLLCSSLTLKPSEQLSETQLLLNQAIANKQYRAKVQQPINETMLKQYSNIYKLRRNPDVGETYENLKFVDLQTGKLTKEAKGLINSLSTLLLRVAVTTFLDQGVSEEEIAKAQGKPAKDLNKTEADKK